MSFLRDVLWKRQGWNSEARQVGEGEKVRADDLVGIRDRWISETDVDDEVFEASAGEGRSDAVANGTGHISVVEYAGSDNLEGEMVADGGSLGRGEVGIGTGFVIFSGQIHIHGRASTVTQAEVQREATLQNPAASRHDKETCEQPLESHQLSEAREAQGRRARLREKALLERRSEGRTCLIPHVSSW